MANNFFNDSNKAYSENLNDCILVGNAFDWTVDVSLPTDTDGVFPNSSTIVMAKVADVSITPNSNLSIGSTIGNSSGSSQVYRLTVYPNFNRFGGFKSISLTADSGVTFYIANKGGTSPIANNLDYDDLSNVPELKVLKEYDIVITIPSNKEVTGLEFVFQSSSASVSGSISQFNVTGLDDRLDAIEDSVFVELTSSTYNATIDTAFTITAKVTDLLGDAVSGKSITLYHNGTSVSSKTTNSSGEATWTITPTTWGLHDFSINQTHCQVNVTGWRTILGSVGDSFYAQQKADNIRFVLNGWGETTTATTTWASFGSGAKYLENFEPKTWVVRVNHLGNTLFRINPDGTIAYRSLSGTVSSTKHYIQIDYTMK
jgi:hypothetical protein